MTQENFDNQYATKADLKELSEKVATKTDIKELLEAIQLFSGTVDKEFKEVKTRLTNLEENETEMKSSLTAIKSTMVTKDYLDEKLGDLRGDMTVLIRKEDNKVKALVEVLVEKKVLNKADQKKIYSLEPFAHI